MKIAFVLDDSLDRTDGVQQYVLGLGQWLSDRGHAVHYLVGETKRQDIEHVHSLAKNIGVSFNGNHLSIPLPANRKQLQQVLASEQFDILHIQAPYSPFLAGRIVRLAPPETLVVATFHILPYSAVQKVGARLLALINRRTARSIQQAVSVSAAAKDFALAVFGLKTIVLPNVIDYQRFQRAKLQHKGPVKNIVFLGRHVKRKGCMEFLKAIHHLAKTQDMQNIRVHIGGSGVLSSRLKNYVHEHGLGGIVVFKGYISEAQKPEFLAQADIAVFPSLGGESFGIVLAESMAAGAGVVVGGDNSGYRCVLGDWPECLVNPNDTKAFADQLARLMRDSHLRQRIHTEQQLAVTQYAVDRVGVEVELIYKSVIAKNTVNKDN